MVSLRNAEEKDAMLNQIQPDANIPKKLHQLTECQHVGTPLKIYQSTKIFQGFIIASLSLTLLLSLFVIWRALNQGLFLIGLGYLLLLCVLCVFTLKYRESRSRLYVCSQGLLSIDGKKQEGIRWDEIQRTYDGGSGIQLLTNTEGKKFTISSNLSLSRLAELSAIIEDAIKEVKIAAVLAQYERGETVHFGNLEVNQYGIVDLDAAVTWELLEDVRLEKDVLSLKYDGEWHDWYGAFSPKIYVPNYMYPPNLPVFLALTQHILSHKNEALQENRNEGK